MPTPWMIGLIRFALALALLLSGGVLPAPAQDRHAQDRHAQDRHAQDREAPRPDGTVLMDSTTTALQRFRSAERPTASDTAAVRSWTKRLRALGDSLEAVRPARARTLLELAYDGAQVVQDSVRMATYLNDIGTTYYYQSRFEETLSYWRRALTINREIGRLEGVSGALNNIAIIYARRGDLEEALTRYQEVLRIDRKREAPDGVAAALNNIGLVRENQGQYDRALQRYRESLALERREGNRTGIAQSLTNIANVHETRGDYRKALVQYREAVEIHRDLGNRASLAGALNNTGICYKNLGRYDEALAQYREALAIERELEDRGGVANALSNIGTLHVRQGRLVVALERFQESLRIKRQLGDPVGTAQTLAAIGDARVQQGRYERALSRYRESRSILEEIGDPSGVAMSFRQMGDIYRRQGRLEKARSSLQEALQLHQDLGEAPSVAATLTALGEVTAGEGRLQEALVRHREALRINRQTGRRPEVAQSLYHIGALQLRRGETAEATRTLNRAVAVAEDVRRNATSREARQSYLATQVDAYHALATAHARADRPRDALRAVERARARQLAERIADGPDAEGQPVSVPPVDSLRSILKSTETAVLYANATNQRPLLAVVVTRDSVVTRELSQDSILAAVRRAFGEELTALRSRRGPLVTRPRGADGRAVGQNEPTSQRSTGLHLAEALRLYRDLLTQPPRVSESINPSGPDASLRDRSARLGRHLHALLLEPLRPFLDETTQLTIVPSGMLGVIPFETLTATDGRYLIEHVGIRYAPSLTVLRRLKARTPPPRNRTVLAFGGALYRPPPQPTQTAGETPVVLTEGAADGAAAEGPPGRSSRSGRSGNRESRDSTAVQTLDHTQQLLLRATRQLRRGRSPAAVYEQLGYTYWPDLPDTGREVRQIGRISGGGATVLTGRQVTESRLRLLSRTGKLDNYRWLHFATHGVAVAEAPDLSALVLSRVGASDSTADNDGFLTMHEIDDLRIRSDVTVLSACQSGLGPVVAGEGVVGLSHAFLRAGSRATLVSQWAVLDRSTRQFMTAVYRHARRSDRSFAEAVAQVKRDFIAGHHGTANRDPLRWAPFVYYGHE